MDVKSVFNRRDSRDGLVKATDGFIEDCKNLLADEDQIVAEFAVNMLANISQGIFFKRTYSRVCLGQSFYTKFSIVLSSKFKKKFPFRPNFGRFVLMDKCPSRKIFDLK